MNVTISLHGWDWVWLLVTIGLASFVSGFFSAMGRDLGRELRKRR